ncbi:hypothetical protein BBJ28_00011852 [Nothophytophthora sp. Chile5]|nr:hypothetical protein BBJ28_00011852 [Nothophytophthora sp. Chile5]
MVAENEATSTEKLNDIKSNILVVGFLSVRLELQSILTMEKQPTKAANARKATKTTGSPSGVPPANQYAVATAIPFADPATSVKCGTVQKPILSKVIGRECSDQVEFGRKWQSEVYDLGAVLIDATDIVYSVGCVFRCDLPDARTSSIVCSHGPRHTFVLMDGEFIERLHVRRSSDLIVSLKISTNLRASQWFGGQGGRRDVDHCQLEEITAPRGYYVAGLYGSHNGKWCNQLGCRFDVLTRSSRVDPIRGTPSEQQVKAVPVTIRKADNTGKTFFYSHARLQAIAMTCDNHRLRAVSIVTGEQYARYLRDRESALGKNEHLLELIMGEQIRRVDVCRTISAVTGLRFVTNLRTSQWFGRVEGGSIAALALAKSESRAEMAEDIYLCGFFGTRDVDGICSLGAVYQVKPPPHDASKDIARWEAMRDDLLPVRFSADNAVLSSNAESQE